MSLKVFTGWRTVTPGPCSACGYSDGWDCDGRGSIFCDCQRCPDCGEVDGHSQDCATNEPQDEEDAL